MLYRRTYSIIAIVLILSFMSGLYVFAEPGRVQEFLALERFDGSITNTVEIDSVNIDGGTAKISEAGMQNKALLSEKTQSVITISKALDGDVENEFVFSVKFKPENSDLVNMKIGMASGSTFVPILYVNSNQIETSQGKRIGNIGGTSFTELTVMVNRRAEVCSVYVDKKLKLEGWRVSGLSGDFDSMHIYKSSLSGGVYIDDIVVYNGTDVNFSLPNERYSTDVTDDIYVEQDAGDFTYFHSHAMYSQAMAYYNLKTYPKTNSIECERLDYKNINKGESIIFTKTTSDDCYVDITLNKMKNYDSSRTYSYFYIASDIMCEDPDMQAQVFLLRDTKTSSSQINSIPANIKGSSIVTEDGKTITNAVIPGQWFRYELFVNLETHMADIYINGEAAALNVPLEEKMQTLNMVRFSVSGNSAPGVIKLKNFEVTGIVNPPSNGTYEKTSIFPDDTPIEEYLEDKISFHHFSGIMYKNGQKTDLVHNSVYQDSELYLSAEDISNAFGIECSVDEKGETLFVNGQETEFGGIFLSLCSPMIPIGKFAREVLGKYTLDDGYGMVIVSDSPMYFDVGAEIPYYKQTYRNGYFTYQSTIQMLNAFLFFERPKKDVLLEKFNATTGGSVHPRLLATKEDFERIQTEALSDEGLAWIVELLIQQAEDIIPQEICTTYTFQDAFRQNGYAMNFEERMMYLGFAYQITGDKKYLDRAWLEIEGISKYPDINENHPIDAGSYSAGLAIGYDWFYSGLTDEQKKLMEDTAYRLSLSIMDRVFYAGLPGSSSNLSTVSTNVSSIFAKWKSNYNLWVNGGLVLAAIAYMDIYPDLCGDLLQQSLRSIEYNLYGFAPDGQWPEGNQYWDVCMNNLAKIISSLDCALGTDYGIMKYQGLDKTGYFAAGWASPLGSIANGDTNIDEGIFSYFSQSFLSKYFNQKGLAYIRQMNLSGDYTSYGIYEPEAHPIDALFYTAGVTAEDTQNIPRMIVAKGAESVTVHEDYTNPQAFVFAAQGGQTTHYHSHNDGGAFAFDMMGVRWATDLGRDNYNLGVSDSEIYRKRTEGHNTLTINNDDGFSQKENTFAELIDSASSETGGYAVYDLSELYEDADSVIRGFYIGDDYTSLTVRDEIELNRESEIYWFMHTKANIEILDTKTALLSKNGKSLILQMETDAAEFELSTMKAEPLPSSPVVEGQGGNEGISKVAIRLKDSGNVTLTVRMSPWETDNIPNEPISSWKVPGGTHSNVKDDFGYQLYVDDVKMKDSSTIPVVDEDIIPEFRVVPNDSNKKVVIVADDAEVNGEVSIEVISADGTKVQKSRIVYSATSSAILDFYDQYRAKAITVSEEPEAANNGQNAIDGDLSTRWTCKTIGAEGIFDFGESIEFDAVSTAFWLGSERKYKYTLYGSENGVDYEKIADITTSGTSEDYEVYKLDKMYNARYIKFVNNGNPANVNGNITEMLLLKRKGV